MWRAAVGAALLSGAAHAQIRPSYKCSVDEDCASVDPQTSFNYVFCDHEVYPGHGLCHFNNDGKGVPVDRHGQCPLGCAHAAADCGTPLPGSEAGCCVKDYADFGGQEGCAAHGCVPEGACTSADPRCYGAFRAKNAFCEPKELIVPANSDDGKMCDRSQPCSGVHSIHGYCQQGYLCTAMPVIGVRPIPICRPGTSAKQDPFPCPTEMLCEHGHTGACPEGQRCVEVHVMPVGSIFVCRVGAASELAV